MTTATSTAGHVARPRYRSAHSIAGYAAPLVFARVCGESGLYAGEEFLSAMSGVAGWCDWVGLIAKVRGLPCSDWERMTPGEFNVREPFAGRTTVTFMARDAVCVVLRDTLASCLLRGYVPNPVMEISVSGPECLEFRRLEATCAKAISAAPPPPPPPPGLFVRAARAVRAALTPKFKPYKPARYRRNPQAPRA